MKAVTKRIVKQMIHDKRSLALILVAPLILLTLLFLLLGKSSYVPKVATQNLPSVMQTALEKQDKINIVVKNNAQSNEEYLKDKKADALIYLDEEEIQILMLDMDSVKLSLVTEGVKSVATKISPSGQMNISFIYGKANESIFDSMGYMLLAVLAFFMIFLVSGISFVRERTSNTIERLMRSPTSTISIVVGYILGFGIFAILQSFLMISFAKFILNMQFVGAWWLATFIMLLIAMIAVMMGILVSIVSKNEFQVVQFIPLMIIPQIFFSGLISVDTLPYHLSYLSRIMPLYYGSMGLKGVLVYGEGIGEVFSYIFALIVFIVLLFIANILAVKKYRTA